MHATQVLRDEHEGILAMLAVLEAAAYRAREGQSVPASLFVDAFGFFRNFADKCHHGKEEAQLFPKLVERGIPNEGGPVGMMLAEHVQGRAFVRGIGEAGERYAKGDQAAVPDLVKNSLGYVRLLRQHIDKENGVLFQMADAVLSDAEQRQLYAAFEQIEANEMGPGVHERYHAMIGEYQKLAAEWERAPAQVHC
ncbi:MAG: hemerythrin domain-containing protein [Chloroflexi bacterium]|nr:hemerythrin domain-containing protein [Chloroflexota bacterium]